MACRCLILASDLGVCVGEAGTDVAPQGKEQVRGFPSHPNRARWPIDASASCGCSVMGIGHVPEAIPIARHHPGASNVNQPERGRRRTSTSAPPAITDGQNLQTSSENEEFGIAEKYKFLKFTKRANHT